MKATTPTAFLIAIILGALSAGVTTSLGILYALVGSIVLLPPMLRRIYTPRPPDTPT